MLNRVGLWSSFQVDDVVQDFVRRCDHSRVCLESALGSDEGDELLGEINIRHFKSAR